MKSFEVAALVAGRALALLGALLLLLALGWPWATLTISSSDLRQDLRLSLSGGDITAFGASQAAVAPQLAALFDQLDRLVPVLSTDRTYRQLRGQVETERQSARWISAWVASIWAPPIVAMVLALVLLATHQAIRFRRVFGAAISLAALVSLVTLILTRMGIDHLIAQLRAYPGLVDAFDVLDRSRIDISLRSDTGITAAVRFAIVIFVGGLVELVLPFRLAARMPAAAPAALPASAPTLQPAGAVLEIAAAGSSFVEPAAGRGACVQCGRPLLAGARFCGACGTRQE